MFSFDIVDKAAAVSDLLNKFRQWFGLDSNAFVNDFDLASSHIYIQFITGCNFFNILANFQHRQPDVDCIAVKNTAKAVGNNAFYAFDFDNDRSMLARRTTPNILASFNIGRTGSLTMQ